MAEQLETGPLAEPEEEPCLPLQPLHDAQYFSEARFDGSDFGIAAGDSGKTKPHLIKEK